MLYQSYFLKKPALYVMAKLLLKKITLYALLRLLFKEKLTLYDISKLLFKVTLPTSRCPFNSFHCHGQSQQTYDRTKSILPDAVVFYMIWLTLSVGEP